MIIWIYMSYCELTAEINITSKHHTHSYPLITINGEVFLFILDEYACM